MIKKIKIKIYERRAPLSATSIIWFTESEGQNRNYIITYIDSKAFVSVPLKTGQQMGSAALSAPFCRPPLSSVFLEGGGGGLQNF
jgi:hypothetical protein